MASPNRPWHGTLAIAPGRAVYIGPAGDTERHRHHAIQVAVALDDPVLVVLPDESTTDCWAAVVGPDVQHAIDARGSWVGLYYVEGDSEEGRILSVALGPSGWAVPARPVASALEGSFRNLPPDPVDDDLRLLGAEIAGALGLCKSEETPSADEVVDAAIATLKKVVPGEIRAAGLADRVGVPQRDLSAAFRRVTGLSIRSYVLWLRLQLSVRALAGGSNLTEAAHAAGFADGAHMSRVFRDTFGVPPSIGVGRARILSQQP